MTRRIVLVSVSAMLALALTAGARDLYLPEDFDLSGVWEMPGPTRSRMKSMPDRQPYFWNTDVMAGREWLVLEPADPFVEIRSDPSGFAFYYVGTHHHVHGFVDVDEQQMRYGDVCAVHGMDFIGSGELFFDPYSKHYEFSFTGDLPYTPVYRHRDGARLEAGQYSWDGICDIRNFFRDEAGSRIFLGLQPDGEEVDGLNPDPDCGSECEEPFQTIFGGDTTFCNHLLFQRKPGLPADFTGPISGQVVVNGSNEPVNSATVRLIQQAGPLAEPAPDASVLDYLQYRSNNFQAETEVDAQGRFHFDGAPLMGLLTGADGERLGWVGAKYALVVTAPMTTGMDPNNFPSGRIIYQSAHQMNIEVPDSPVTIQVDAIPYMLQKARDIIRLCDMSPNNYCEWEQAGAGHATAQGFLDLLADPGHDVTDAQAEAVGRGAWAEMVVIAGADYSRDLLRRGLIGMGLILADVVDLMDFDGANVAVAKRWKNKELEPGDWDMIQRNYGAGQGHTGNYRAIADRLDKVATDSEALEELGSVVKIFRTTVMQMAELIAPDALPEEIEQAGDYGELVMDTVLGFLTSRALGKGGWGAGKPALAEAVKFVPPLFAPMLFDNAVAPEWVDWRIDSVPSFCQQTTPLLQFSVEQMVAWAVSDPVTFDTQTDAAAAVVKELNHWGQWTTEGWIWATEFFSDTFGTAADIFAFGADVNGYFKAAEKISKAIQYGADGFAFAAPLAYVYLYAPKKMEEGVYAAFGMAPPPPVQPSPRPQAPEPDGWQPYLLTIADVQAAHTQLNVGLLTLRDALSEGRIGDAILALESGDTLSGMDALQGLATQIKRLLSAATAMQGHSLANKGTDLLVDVVETGRKLKRHRRAMEERLLVLFGKVLDGQYGEGGPLYEAERARAVVEVEALRSLAYTVKDELEAAMPSVEAHYAGQPAAVAVDILSIASDSSGEQAISASPEELTVRARVHNLGAVAVADISLVLDLTPADRLILLTPPEVAPAGGQLTPDDAAAGSGTDEALLEWRLRYEGDLTAPRPCLLRISVREAGTEPVGLVAFDAAAVLRVEQTVFDADLDGLPDAYEAEVGLDPGQADAFGDLDGDGLLNRFEYGQGLDPSAADSDGDGLSDGEEVEAGVDGLRTNPRLADTDGDGTPDGADGSPVDPTSIQAGPVVEEPVVAVSATEVVLTPDESLVAVTVTNAGGSYLKWTSVIENDAVARLHGPQFPKTRPAPGALLIEAPGGVELEQIHGLETTVWVIDTSGKTHDQVAVRVRIDAPSGEIDGGDGGEDGSTDGGGGDEGPTDGSDAGADGGTDPGGKGGCGCGSKGPIPLAVLLGLGFISVLAGLRRRRSA